MAPTRLDVRNNEAKSRFEIDTPDGELGVAEYRLVDDTIIFIHTEVPNPESNKGFGSALAEAGMDYARRNRLKVIPRCPFIAAYIQRHPEHQDLLQGAG